MCDSDPSHYLNFVFTAAYSLQMAFKYQLFAGCKAEFLHGESWWKVTNWIWDLSSVTYKMLIKYATQISPDETSSELNMHVLILNSFKQLLESVISLSILAPPVDKYDKSTPASCHKDPDPTSTKICFGDKWQMQCILMYFLFLSSYFQDFQQLDQPSLKNFVVISCFDNNNNPTVLCWLCPKVKKTSPRTPRTLTYYNVIFWLLVCLFLPSGLLFPNVPSSVFILI